MGFVLFLVSGRHMAMKPELEELTHSQMVQLISWRCTGTSEWGWIYSKKDCDLCICLVSCFLEAYGKDDALAALKPESAVKTHRCTVMSEWSWNYSKKFAICSSVLFLVSGRQMAMKTALAALKLAYNQKVPWKPIDDIMELYSDVRMKLIWSY